MNNYAISRKHTQTTPLKSITYICSEELFRYMEQPEILRRIEKMERELRELKEDLEENWELSNEAIATIKKARKAPRSEYVELSEL